MTISTAVTTSPPRESTVCDKYLAPWQHWTAVVKNALQVMAVQRPGFDRASENEGAAPAGASSLAGLAVPGPGQWHQCTKRALTLPGPPRPGLRPGWGRAPAPAGIGPGCRILLKTPTVKAQHSHNRRSPCKVFFVFSLRLHTAWCFCRLQIQSASLHKGHNVHTADG